MLLDEQVLGTAASDYSEFSELLGPPEYWLPIGKCDRSTFCRYQPKVTQATLNGLAIDRNKMALTCLH